MNLFNSTFILIVMKLFFYNEKLHNCLIHRILSTKMAYLWVAWIIHPNMD